MVAPAQFSAPFNYTNGTLAGQNVMYFFQYANSVTGNLFVFFTVLAFFLVILISSIVMQIRFSGAEGMRFDKSFLIASFSTLGFAILLSQISGLLPVSYFIVLIVLTIFSFIWMALSNE